jgi:hypothetical protein
MKATSMYALSLDQLTTAMLAGGSKRTTLVQGNMGTGKSSLLRMLGAELPKHTMCYFDCTTKDLGDITIPQLHTLTTDEDDTACVRYVPNEELGLHLSQPIILMIDEYGKANRAVQNAMLRLMLERQLGSHKLHPESIVFATTNLGAEGVGDLLPAHARNRISVVTSRKPSNLEWVEWGVNNGVDPTLLGWCMETPQLFYSFEEVNNPEDNPYIFHPQAQRAAFVTPRSLEAASDWIKVRDKMDDSTLTALLIGTIGERGALDLMAWVKLSDQLPKLDDIKKTPLAARVPDSAAAVCMVVHRTLQCIERDWVDAWMQYFNRLDKEAQGMFVNGVRHPKYTRQNIVMTNKAFTSWAMANTHLYAADKK